MKFSWEMTETEKAEAAAAKAAALDAAIKGIEDATGGPDAAAKQRECLDKMFGKGNYRIIYGYGY